MFKTSDIVVQDRMRPAGDVADLAESINSLGLLNPITVVLQRVPGLESAEAPILVAGLRRLEACKSLGWDEIPTNVVELYDLDLKLAEIDENIIRLELSALQRGEQLEERKWIYEQKYPETRQGVAGGKARQGTANETVSFAENTAKSIGSSKRSVELDVAAVSGIPQALRSKLSGTGAADNKKDLRALSRKKDDPAVQSRAVDKYVSGEASSLREALKTKKAPTKSQEDAGLDQFARYLVELGADPERLKILFAPLKKKNPMCSKVIWRLQRDKAA